MDASTERSDALRRFAAAALAPAGFSLAAASADASFRRYWRATLADGTTRIVMDAPPGAEDIRPWLDIGARLRSAGLHAPAVFAADAAQGFVLMEDLGTRDYLSGLTDASVDVLYGEALDALVRMQARVDTARLPAFDTAFATAELELMPEWFLRRHLGHAVDCDEWDVIELAFRRLVAAARQQPQAFMHRDYHSRNLMRLEASSGGDEGIAPGADRTAPWLPRPGIIDFQGAMRGPLAYDLASLLRDCYIEWDAERVDGWTEAHRLRLRHAHLLGTDVDAGRFRAWVDLCGLQRHLKVLGIFCRLWYRDGKPQYLADLPRVWHYVRVVARRHHELAPLADVLERALGGRDIRVPRGDA
jgi:aminoglycoside/choline kinase family phosphotransferase